MIVTVNDGREDSTPKKLRIVVKDVNEQQTGFHEAQYTIEATEGAVRFAKRSCVPLVSDKYKSYFPGILTFVYV